MRATDNRYRGERARFELAMRMIRHEARTGTIRYFTGLSDDRIRKLYTSYFKFDEGAPVKRRRGSARAVEPLPQAELQSMPTRALLARLERLRWCEDSQRNSDLSDAEVAAVDGKILYKDSDIWRSAHQELKAELSTREHARKPKA